MTISGEPYQASSLTLLLRHMVSLYENVNLRSLSNFPTCPSFSATPPANSLPNLEDSILQSHYTPSM